MQETTSRSRVRSWDGEYMRYTQSQSLMLRESSLTLPFLPSIKSPSDDRSSNVHLLTHYLESHPHVSHYCLSSGLVIVSRCITLTTMTLSGHDHGVGDGIAVDPEAPALPAKGEPIPGSRVAPSDSWLLCQLIQQSVIKQWKQ